MKRGVDDSIIENLKSSDLWTKHLNADCLNEKVFLAVRDEIISFYYKGGKLFEFDKNGFKTHKKYASVIEWKNDLKNDYLEEKDLSTLKIIPNFKSGYRGIKENCSNYSGVESIGVSDIYHKYSYLSESNIVLLDIEVSFESIDKTKEQDRIDILLFNKETKTLQFVEAKHFSNQEIWSTTPKVINQIKRYERQVEDKKDEIISQYKIYVQAINSIFGISLPEPDKIEEKVILLVFGFDDNQRSGRLHELRLRPEYKEIKKYMKGKIANLVIENLWNTSK